MEDFKRGNFQEAVVQACSIKKGVLRNFAKFTRRVSFLIKLQT